MEALDEDTQGSQGVEEQTHGPSEGPDTREQSDTGWLRQSSPADSPPSRPGTLTETHLNQQKHRTEMLFFFSNDLCKNQSSTDVIMN